MLLSRLARQELDRVGKEVKQTPFPDPALWVAEYLDLGTRRFASYQLDAIDRIRKHRRVCWRSPHGVGKTTTAALLILIFAQWCEKDQVDWKIVTTASSWRQLSSYLWPEVRKWATRLRKSKWDLNLKRDLIQTTLKGRYGTAFAVASNRSELIEGAHADRLLYVYDEAKAIPEPTWDGIEGAFSAGEAWAFAMSTPGDATGRFYDLQTGRTGAGVWDIVTVSLKSAMAEGRVKQSWVDECRKLWGEKAAAFKRRVLGEFAEDEENALIPLSWVEDAIERWKDIEESKAWGPRTCVGCDVAYTGSDKTTFASRHGWGIKEILSRSGISTMETAGILKNMIDGCYGVVDGIGLGAGVYDRCLEQGCDVVSFIAGEGAAEHVPMPEEVKVIKRKYANLRAQAWWLMHDLLDPDNKIPIALPDDRQLVGDLVAPHRFTTSNGSEIIEAKEKVRARIGRSTDKGDAVVMAFWPKQQPRGILGFIKHQNMVKQAKAQVSTAYETVP